jgi:hypothetical protein
MSKIRSMMGNQATVGEPERRGDERSETPRSGGSSTVARADAASPRIPRSRPGIAADDSRRPTSSRSCGRWRRVRGTAELPVSRHIVIDCRDPLDFCALAVHWFASSGFSQVSILRR